MIKYLLIGSFLVNILFSCTKLSAQKTQAPPKNIVPAVHSLIQHDPNGFYITVRNKKIYERVSDPAYTLDQLMGDPQGTDSGIAFNFPNIEGKLYFGFIPYGDSKHPHPVYFRLAVPIEGDSAAIDIRQHLSGRYDMVGWEQKSKGTLGYRVVNSNGSFLYDGIVSFSGNGPFKVEVTMVEGPFVNLISPQGATISFTLSQPAAASVSINGQNFKGPVSKIHEIPVSGLEPNRDYDYAVQVGENEYQFQLKSAPLSGSRTPFIFSYASDSRSGNGGGERDIWGANSYIMKKIMALNKAKDAVFMQFSGDLINGYETHPDAMRLQYANWKRAIQPFAHYLPVYVSMGNHEALDRVFYSFEERVNISVDRFPYDTESAESIFAESFVNPQNGPESEDNAEYDPNPSQIDFPSYRENVFFYTYDNVAVVVLNSDYWYSPSTGNIPFIGGGLHGYIMDNQMNWLSGVLDQLEEDQNIDHIFMTQHTPFFPNGGHVQDDMWYNGDNTFRPYVAGKALNKGIIERRDQLLELAVNKSSKVIAILTGDEHNYNRTEIGPQTQIYPENYTPEKIALSRTIYQINNGAAGAPYYAQEQTPWTPFVKGFTTQNALVFFHVNGKELHMEVLNPDTLEKFDDFKLR